MVSPTQKNTQSSIKHINKPIGSGPLSPSRSMKSIGQPYQCKTMAEINKFTEERNGCKSVMHKHKYNNLQAMQKQESKQYISIDPASKTFDMGNSSQGSASILNGNQSPMLFHGKDAMITQAMSFQLESINSCNNSPMIFDNPKSR